MATFKNELTSLLNRTCAENSSDTPDFILARYLIGCLDAFNIAVNEREQWYNRKNTSIQTVQNLPCGCQVGNTPDWLRRRCGCLGC